MRTRMLWLAGLAVLLQGGALAAQEQRTETAPAAVAANAAPVVAVGALALEQAVPVLKVEAEKGAAAARAQWKGEQGGYDAVKNALIVARLDARNPNRLAGLEKAASSVRKANRDLYERNFGRLDPLLDNVVPSPGCALCRATAK